MDRWGVDGRRSGWQSKSFPISLSSESAENYKTPKRDPLARSEAMLLLGRIVVPELRIIDP